MDNVVLRTRGSRSAPGRVWVPRGHGPIRDRRTALCAGARRAAPRRPRQPDGAEGGGPGSAVLKRTFTRVQGGQPHRLGGRADLLRRAGDLPGAASRWSRSSACSAQSADAAADRQPRHRSRPARPRTSSPARSRTCRTARARPGIAVRRRHRAARCGRRRATSARSCARPTRSTRSARAGRSGSCAPLQLGVTAGDDRAAGRVSAIAVVVTGGARQAGRQRCSASATPPCTVWDIAKWPVLLLVVSLMFAILYWAAPNVKQPGFRWITPGRRPRGRASGSSPRRLFALYVANFGSYNKTYGALGGVIVVPGLAVDLQHRDPARRRAQRRARARPRARGRPARRARSRSSSRATRASSSAGCAGCGSARKGR